MGFFKKILKKIKPAPMAKVYGGPEYFKRKQMECVYAGPEYFDKKRKDAELEDVYNGPEPDDDPIIVDTESDAPYPENHADTDSEPDYPNNHADEDTEEDGTDDGGDLKESKIKPSSPIGFVYAGPGYFSNDKGPIEAVYAGPNPRPETFMCVYAGPDYFAPKIQTQQRGVQQGLFTNQPAPAPEPVDPNNLPEGSWFCTCCGHLNTGKFCSECGAPRKDDPPAGPNPTMLA